MLLFRLVLVWCFAALSLNSDASPHLPDYGAPINVTILVDDAYPPYSYQANGELYGIYVDIVKQAARLLSQDYRVTLQAVPWKRGVSSMASGEAMALMPPYIHIKKRPYIWPYSVPLQEEVVVAFCNSGYSLKKLPHIHPETPINVGVNAGYMILDENLMEAQKLGLIKLWENKSTNSNIEKLARGRIDCYVNDRLSTLLGINKMSKISSDLNAGNIVEDKIIMRRTAHIGYLKGYEDKYPYKQDFILKMDQALREVIATSASPSE
ncbi:substrate-binding periplasmic protein [Pseudoalteromonas piscicida]|uniref:Amino acid ABC transporter substrate-binding protein n=1 Tax=Pseudoalteromonas piscicida TaxID=43662 RepID=A0A2A5JUT2_PSEO7|nr:transporter substrate-binding domain-containing protein [Pseudoalteromonas piscicida]PCK33089.1 amino acid ABC transporter substrate-binding protein [Pseudoalteromonas piscicida]